MITLRHLENCAKVMLATGWVVTFGYVAETFTAWYSGDPWEIAMMRDRLGGVYAPIYWGVLFCNVLVPQTLWWRAARRNVAWLFALSIVVNVGMWMERFVIVVQSMHHDFLPSSWYDFRPTGWDWTHLFGSIGLFALLFMLFIRFLPAISIYEMREQAHERALTP
jgi:Ni/Fe-hydrogenase subunit HybB-like protein